MTITLCRRGRPPRPLPRLTRDQQALVRRNLGLVHATAKRLWPLVARGNSGMSLSDVEQAGMVGLCKAAALYDPDRGTQFSTYAVVAIRQNIQIASDTGLVALPAGKASEVRQQLAGVRSDVACFEAAYRSFLVYSIDAPGDGDSDDSRDLVPGSGDEPGEQAAALEQQTLVRRALRRLDARQRQVLDLRIAHGLTLREVGEQLHLSKERVRQIEAAALQRLRELLPRMED